MYSIPNVFHAESKDKRKPIMQAETKYYFEECYIFIRCINNSIITI